MHSPEEFRDDHTPFGYLITFRCYGTWLHGKSGSVDRFHRTHGTPTLAADAARLRYNRRALAQSPVTLRAKQRALVEEAIRETCEIRKWSLWTINVRTNHVHTVVTANCKPERALNAFKANATRKLEKQRGGTAIAVPGHMAVARDIFGPRKNSLMLSLTSEKIRASRWTKTLIQNPER